MVGYQKDDSLTSSQKIIAGCLSGITTRALTQPLDAIKLRVQLQKKAIPNPDWQWFKVTRNIYTQEGLKAFWHGHNIGQVQSIVSVASQFYAFELATEMVSLTDLASQYLHVTNFLCGVFAGFVGVTLANPLDVVKTRQMLSKSQYGDFLNSAKKVYQSGGVTAFYEGWVPAWMMVGPQLGISFGVFNYLQPLLLSYAHDCVHRGACHLVAGNAHRPENIVLASALAGAAAGLVSKTVIYPLDLAKKRLQIKTHKQDEGPKSSLKKDIVSCNTLFQCLKKTLKVEGFRGLFRGWKITVYKSIATSIVTFTSYELFCYSLRESENKQDSVSDTK